MRRPLAALAAVAGALAAAGPAAADPLWRLEQPPPPPGAPFKVPLGRPGDLQFLDRSHGLLMIEGNSTIPRGLYAYNGESWHELATVCGGQGDTARVAFAGPDEWWTISEPSQPRVGNGTSLCHFKDGEVVASYGTPYQAADPIQQMDAAACAAPDDCWFGGFDASTPTGDRRGAFHLHWDGSSLKTVYAPFGRGITDIDALGSSFFETSVLGARPEDTGDALQPPDPSPTPALIHEITGGSFTADPFTPASQPDGSELLTVDGDGSQVWVGGGGAASGPAPADGTSVARPPLAARSTGGAFDEVPLDPTLFGTNDRFGDIAAVPDTETAWAAVQPFAQRNSTTAKAKVVQLSPAGAMGTVTSLPSSGAGRGVAAKVSFAAPNDGWLVTYAGWLFHYTDGSSPPRNDDPAWQGTITFRPNEAAAQFVPDTPPPDDSQFFAPPPVDVNPPATTAPPGKPLKALLRHVKVRVRHRTLLVVTFDLTRKAKVGLVARRKGKVVAKTPYRLMRKGRHTLKLRLNPRRWPTKLAFKTYEPDQGSSGDVGTVTTGGGPTGSDTSQTGDTGNGSSSTVG